MTAKCTPPQEFSANPHGLARFQGLGWGVHFEKPNAHPPKNFEPIPTVWRVWLGCAFGCSKCTPHEKSPRNQAPTEIPDGVASFEGGHLGGHLQKPGARQPQDSRRTVAGQPQGSRRTAAGQPQGSRRIAAGQSQDVRPLLKSSCGSWPKNPGIWPKNPGFLAKKSSPFIVIESTLNNDETPWN